MVWEGIVGVIAAVCAVWVIYDVWMHNHKYKQIAKVIWTIAALIGSILTAILYYFFGR